MESSNRCTKFNDKSLTLKFHQSYKSIGGIREEEQRKSTKNSKFLQDLDLGGSSHKERDLIGEDVDLDLLYLSLKGIQESWEGEREIGSSRKVSNGGKIELGEVGNLWGRRPLK